MKLFVGLGNPGSEYARNRHNAGFMAVERIASEHAFGPWKKKFHALACEGEIGGERVLILKPQTYMNESGQAVAEAARFLKIPEDGIIVFYDEIDLPPAKLKVKTGGGNAGHNGLRSISAHLDNDYVRVRIGVGHPGVKELVVKWVLNDFSKADHEWLEPLLEAVAKSAGWLVKGDQSRFMAAVLKLTKDEEDPNMKPKADAPRDKKEERSKNTAHPAGEAAAKRQTALADNLKKWLAGKKPQN